MDIRIKKQKLDEWLLQAGRVLVAFSAGVDSTFLLHEAFFVLKENAIAITAVSKAFPERELEAAKAFCQERGIEQILIETEELSIEGFDKNPKNRCYLCKRALFQKIKEVAQARGIPYIIEGSNLDDDADYRPGAAAIRELGIKSPLKDAGLTKEDIRKLSFQEGLSTWNKPSMACLYSRFVYGEQITEEKLAMIAKAEQFLVSLGFSQVRVRLHGEIARIEVEKEAFEKLASPEMAQNVTDHLKKLGFSYVTMDLSGYRTGSMNEQLS